MVEGAAEVAIVALKMGLRMLVMIPIIFVFVAIMASLIQVIYSFSSEGLVADIFSVIQIWLPFDMGVILMYALTTGLLYITYRVAYKMYEMVQSVIGQ